MVVVLEQLIITINICIYQTCNVRIAGAFVDDAGHDGRDKQKNHTGEQPNGTNALAFGQTIKLITRCIEVDILTCNHKNSTKRIKECKNQDVAIFSAHGVVVEAICRDRDHNGR